MSGLHVRLGIVDVILFGAVAGLQCALNGLVVYHLVQLKASTPTITLLTVLAIGQVCMLWSLAGIRRGE